ncbi:MAG: hypothetical protein HYV97_14360 [Bdellovibrio sp.]|nr:hypothetical protein [Bdellovibrio sp.]
MRHDKTLVEQMYKQTFTSNEKRIIFRKVIEESSEAAIITPEGLEISNLKQQISKKITLDARKKIVNKLYEFLAMGNSKHEILLLCAEYFIKVKRKKVAQQIIDFANICLSNDSSFEPRIKEMQEKIKKEKEDKEFQLEKDEIFDLAEDLFSGDLDVLFEGEKKHAYTLDMSLMERDAYLIRKGLVAIDEIANKELKKFPAESENSNRKLEKSLVNAFMDIDLPVKLELYRDLVSALIMFEMLDPALKLCEELMPDLSGIENRISITYLIVMIYFKKENYNRVIELCNSTIASLPLSASDKIAFLRLMAASFQKKGEIKNSIGVNKLIDQIISASNEVHE